MKYYFNNKDGRVYAFDTVELANEWIKQSSGGQEAFRVMTDDEIDRHLHPENYMTDTEKLALRRKDAAYLERHQFLTMTELSLEKNKDALIEAVTVNFKGKSLVKLRNYILESPSFSLDFEELWLLLTTILKIEHDKLFRMWEEAREY
ncbi:MULTISPECIES: hypothetical protein [Snodgrassella]|uniref:hypothetical protein n=1 Tax=Snodgrassella TaxID=1193515 RepID=UPI00081553B7|nr:MULTISPECIES: hypothetical protein [Snodgrassella]SCB72154.1 hypothetical protein GA0061082_10155 [Snodgrassella sp. R-53583]